MILYPDEVKSDERKILPFCFAIMLFFFILGVQRTLTGYYVEWSFLIFTGVPSFTILVELFRIWRPILMINEQKVKIRTHPFLPRVKLYWYEISAIIRYRDNKKYYLLTVRSNFDEISKW